MAPGRRSIFGFLLTALVFPLFSWSSSLLLLSTIISTAILFIMFHDLMDLYFAAYMLGLGLVVELFGVFFQVWSYPPQPELMGIPCWCAMMWLSAGILGRRLLFPLAGWIDGMLMHAKHVRGAYGPRTAHGSQPGGNLKKLKKRIEMKGIGSILNPRVPPRGDDSLGVQGLFELLDYVPENIVSSHQPGHGLDAHSIRDVAVVHACPQ